MKKNLTTNQAFTLMTAFLLGNSIAVMGGITVGEKIGYIAIPVAFFVFLLFNYIYKIIIAHNDNKNMIEITKKIFPSIICKLIFSLILIYCVFCATLSAINFMHFFNIGTMGNDSIVFMSLLVILSVFSMLIYQKKAIGRYSSLIFPIVMTLVFIILIFSISKLHFPNLKLTSKITPFNFTKSVFLNFTSSFGNILILYFFLYDVYPQDKLSKTFIYSGLCTTIFFVLIYLLNLLVLGKNLLSKFYYPTLSTFEIISPSFFTQRSDAVFFVSYAFFDILYISVSLSVALSLFMQFFEKKQHSIEKIRHCAIYSICVFIFIMMVISQKIPQFYGAYEYIAYFTSFITLGIPIIFIFKSGLNNINKKQCKND